MIFFVDKCKLPVSRSYKSYGDFKSGAVSFGNCRFEVVEFNGITGENAPEGIIGMTFEPDIKAEKS